MTASHSAPDSVDRTLTPTKLWKASLISFAVIVCMLNLWAVSNWERAFSPEKSGTLGVTLGDKAKGRWRIEALTADSPIAGAGAKVGDSLAFDRYGDRNRVLGVDETIGMTLYSGNQGRHLDVRPVSVRVIAPLEIAIIVLTGIGSLLMLAVGLLIGLRRADSIALRLLAVSFLSQTLHFFTPLISGGSVRDFTAIVFGPLSFILAYSCFLYFALGYPHSSRLLRLAWVRRSFGIYVVISGAILVLSIASRVMPSPISFITFGWLLFAIFSSVASLAALLAGWRSSTGLTRQRFAWLASSTGAIYVAYLVGVVNIAAGEWIDQSAVDVFQGVVISAANCGLGYAVLRHRILDFGFAINRAVVYATTSLLLAGAFMLSGQIVNSLIHFKGREQSRMVDIAIGIVIALMARQAVRWVDPRVQRIFFRRWHDATAKLARFRISAIHGMPTDALQAGLVEAVQGFSGVRACAIYILGKDGAFRRTHSTMEGAPEVLAADHPIVNAMRLTSTAADVAGVSSPLQAVLALPMMVRGRLSGAMLVGEKPDGDLFRKDEVELLTNSVQEVGLEMEVRRLEAIEARHTSGSGG